MCELKKLTDDEILKIAQKDRTYTRDELGIQTPAEENGLKTLTEGFDFLQSNTIHINENKDNKD